MVSDYRASMPISKPETKSVLMARRAETKAVKDALERAGIRATVSHGTGTGWGWLKIRIPESQFCRRFEALTIAQATTGRNGDYDGRINVYS